MPVKDFYSSMERLFIFKLWNKKNNWVPKTRRFREKLFLMINIMKESVKD